MHGIRMDSPARGRRMMNIGTSPERMNRQQANSSSSSRLMRPAFKRVQVVYYLTRNGQLEQPHFMEVTHLAAQQLRLKDVMDRLTVLRGKGMPSMYSWSCKRCYKNGYVWNDLSENDVIYPSEGAEYILKGSEVIMDSSAEIFEAPPVGSSQRFPENSTFLTRRKPPNHMYANEEVYEEKIRYIYPPAAASHHPRCSRGVTAGGGLLNPRNPTTEINLENSSSPPSTTSSSLSDKGLNETSKRFEDGDAVANEPLLSRNSMLYQLIACGGALSFRGKSVAVKSQPPPSPPTLTTGRRSSCSDIHREVLCKNAKNKKAAVADDEDADEIKCMSENPRFGNLQSEEKEYFSGSIVESMCAEEREPSTLKKSSSYNEERGSRLSMVETDLMVKEDEEEEEGEEEGEKGCYSKSKCIPRMKSSSKQLPKK